MGFTRRDLLKWAALGTVSAATGTALASEDEFVADCGENYGVLVDTVVCIGCRKCEWACNNEHKLKEADLKSFEDKSVFEQHRRPTDDAYTVVNRFEAPEENNKQYTIKVQCMHCNSPACVSACIVGALTKSDFGSVDYDAWKCIGCRYCLVACPFQVPAYEYSEAFKPEVRKCTFCAHRLKNGLRPACVSICPNEALTFGTRQELIEVARERIKTHPDKYVDHIYGENEVGGTSWLYLAPTEFTNTELPKLGTEDIPETTEKIQHGIFKSFIPPLALYGLLGLIMRSQGDDEDEKEEDRNVSAS